MVTMMTIMDKHGIHLFLLRIIMAHEEPYTDVARTLDLALVFAVARAVAAAVGVALLSSMFRSSSPHLRRRRRRRRRRHNYAQ